MNKIDKSARIIRAGGVNSFTREVLNWIMKRGAYRPILRVNYLESLRKYGWKHARSPYKIIWIDPRSVKYAGLDYHGPSNTTFNKYIHSGKVISGSWDEEDNLENLSESLKFRAVKKAVSEDSFIDSECFSILCEYVNKYGTFDGCYSPSDIEYRYTKVIPNLYQSISEEGYKSQPQIRNSNSNFASLQEVGVNIGRSGELILGGGGGWHRLSIARILGLKKIPAHTIVRHKKWMDTIMTGDKLNEKCHPDIG